MRLRNKFATYYWIDAICIDQSNIQERNHQVQNMRTIYSEAQSVLIWLGKAEEGPEIAEAIDLISSINIDRWDNRGTVFSERAPWDRSHVNALQIILDAACWQCVWIVQEVTLARAATVLCGSRILDMARLREMLKPELARDKLRNPILDIAESRVGWLCGCSGTKCLDLLDAHVMCAYRKATDVRDRIYALLGVLSDEYSSIPIDYEISSERLWEVVVSHYSRAYADHCHNSDPCSQFSGTEYWRAIPSTGHVVVGALEIEVSEEAIISLAEEQSRFDSILRERRVEAFANTETGA